MRIDPMAEKKYDGVQIKVGIVQSLFNRSLTDQLANETLATLAHHGVEKTNITHLTVPGALETPIAAQKLIKDYEVDMVIALGIVIKGDTYHFELVANESHRGLMDISLQTQTPIIFGILACYTEEQAKERAGKAMNKGKEFAESALHMAQLIKKQK